MCAGLFLCAKQKTADVGNADGSYNPKKPDAKIKHLHKFSNGFDFPNLNDDPALCRGEVAPLVPLCEQMWQQLKQPISLEKTKQLSARVAERDAQMPA